MNQLRSIMMPPAASEYAGRVDDTYMLIFWISLAFFFLVTGLTAYFALHYRRRRGNDGPTPDIRHNTKLETAWTVLPMIPLGIIFWAGFHGFMDARVSPGNALEIKVFAKKWLWAFEYPDGTRAINEIHVPAGRPIRMVMISEDVIHSFFLPTFRVKQDVLPNRYTELWFEADEIGEHVLFCAEYCGKGHSDMLGKVTVDTPADFDEWLATGGDLGKDLPAHEFGKILYRIRGCNTCHALDDRVIEGPSFQGTWGTQRKLKDGTTVTMDENYIRESLMKPQAKIVAGFPATMPTFQGLLREREINALIAMIRGPEADAAGGEETPAADADGEEEEQQEREDAEAIPAP